MTPKTLQKRVRTLALDLRWSWCPSAQALFGAIDPLQWEATNHAPLEVLRRVSDARLAACCEDERFIALLEAAEKARDDHYATPT